MLKVEHPANDITTRTSKLQIVGTIVNVCWLTSFLQHII